MEGTDSEQIEALKSWWNKNGRYVVIGLVVAAIVIGGWKFWDYWEAKQASAAAGLYASVVLAEQKNDLPAISKAAHAVLEQYPDTAYGTLAALALAKAQFVQHHYVKAEQALNRAISHSPDAGFASIARLRLARIQLQQDKPKQTLSTLDSKRMAPAFVISADTLRGEALLALGRTAEAREAWQKARAASDPSGSRYRLLAMRIAGLPAADSSSAAQPVVKARPKTTAHNTGTVSAVTKTSGAAS